MLGVYRYFLDGVPEYLARNYWWAYLWRTGAWFFDHQPVINAILFGNYKRLMEGTLRATLASPPGRTLQLTCVYGVFTPRLVDGLKPARLHLADVALNQLELSVGKSGNGSIAPVRMNAERLGYAKESFDTVVIFFLLHEMPPEARRNTLSEAMRVLSPGGRLIITEYGERPRRNIIYRAPLTRWVMGALEPFLPGFWEEDMDGTVREAGTRNGKGVEKTGEESFFDGFYRVTGYRVLEKSE